MKSKFIIFKETNINRQRRSKKIKLLKAIKIKTKGFKFNRDEANER